MRAASRVSVVLFSIASAACGSETAVAEPAVSINRFAERSPRLSCTRLADDLQDRPHLSRLVTVSDTTFLALSGRDREVMLLGTDLRPRWTIQMDKEGPRGVREPRDVVLRGDTLLYLADFGNRAVRIVSTTGQDRGTVRLRFAPQGIGFLGDTLLVSPLVMAESQETLLFSARGDELQPLTVAVRRHGDVRWTALGNMVAFFALPDGDQLVVHRFMTPTAYVLRAKSGAVDRYVLPLPEREARRVGRLPTLPLTEENHEEVAVPVISGATDRETGDFFYLTRSGVATEQKHAEVALIQVDRTLHYQRSWRLQPNAAHLAYLRASNTFVIVDTQGVWYRCPAGAAAA